MATNIYVEGYYGGPPSDQPKRVTLCVKYAETLARIELPVIAPEFDREPGVDVYRRQIHGLIEALQEWASLHGEVSWRDPQRT
jgi:hypothetical protein